MDWGFSVVAALTAVDTDEWLTLSASIRPWRQANRRDKPLFNNPMR